MENDPMPDPITTAKPLMARYKFQKHVGSYGLTMWSFYFVNPATGKRCAYSTSRSTVDIAKNSYLRARLAQDLLHFRRLCQQSLHA
jgi:hypothetical protein